MNLFFKNKSSEETTSIESKSMTRFWASNGKHILETEGNQVLISTNNRNKELNRKYGFKRTLESIFRKVVKNKFKD
jgi:hypothetical protein